MTRAIREAVGPVWGPLAATPPVRARPVDGSTARSRTVDDDPPTSMAAIETRAAAAGPGVAVVGAATHGFDVVSALLALLGIALLLLWRRR